MSSHPLSPMVGEAKCVFPLTIYIYSSLSLTIGWVDSSTGTYFSSYFLLVSLGGVTLSLIHGIIHQWSYVPRSSIVQGMEWGSSPDLTQTFTASSVTKQHDGVGRASIRFHPLKLKPHACNSSPFISKHGGDGRWGPARL